MAMKRIISYTKPLLKTTLSSSKTPPFPQQPHNTLLQRNHRLLSSSQEPSKTVNTKVNFTLPDSDSDENDNTTPEKPKLPPPYDPFSKKPAVVDPEDPTDLQGVFHKMRTNGLFDSAVKMFDGLSKDGLTHEALELFGQIKDRSQIPDVVAHTAVVEAYANAGQCREALKVFLRMLAAGVAPNAYTYSVLVKGLAADPKFVRDAVKYVGEMMGKGMRPNAGVCVAVFEGLARDGRVEEASELAGRMREGGFAPTEEDVRVVLKGKRGPLVRSVTSVLFGK